MKTRKAQAALEFLMTYGWAILAVLVAIGTLAYFGILSPDKYKSSTCLSEVGISCEGAKMGSYTVATVLSNNQEGNRIINNVLTDACDVKYLTVCKGTLNSLECRDPNNKIVFIDTIGEMVDPENPPYFELNSGETASILIVCNDEITTSKKINVEYNYTDTTTGFDLSSKTEINAKLIKETPCPAPYAECYWGTCDEEHLHTEFTMTCCDADACPSLPPPRPCLLAGTKILIADGSYKNIEDIIIGDKVISKDNKISDVLKTFHDSFTQYFIINEKLRITGEHRVFVNGNWIPAWDIKLGDYLLDKDNLSVKVTSIMKINDNIDTYNFKTTLGTYYAEDILVHNAMNNKYER